MELEKHNFHWRENFFYGFEKKRELFNELLKKIKDKQIISITGLRRTGKTVLLKQLIDYLIIKGAAREYILYFSFDEEQPRISEIMAEYQARLGKELTKITDKICIFLDEIQKLDNWQNQLKYYYDNYPNLKFFISGSSSLFIRKQARESLAGRIYELKLKPLSFREFLLFRNNSDLIKNPRMHKETLKMELQSYMKRQFIEIVDKNEEEIKEYAKTIIEKIVYIDMPKAFPIEYETLLSQLLSVIASQVGMLSDYEGLSKKLGISRVTLSNYFYYLQESFLLLKLYNFSKNLLASEKKMKRFYVTTNSFLVALNDSIDETKLAENLTVIVTDAKFFWRTPQKDEVDVVIEKNNKIIPVEIKYKNEIGKSEIKPLIKFCRKFKSKEAIMITKDIEKIQKINVDGQEITINYIPLWLFLLTEF